MLRKKLLKGFVITITSLSVIIIGSMTVKNPMIVHAKVINTNNRNKPGYTSDYHPPTHVNKSDSSELDTVSSTVPVVKTGDTYKLTGTAVSYQNDAGNPEPVIIDQGNGVYVVAMYQGTSILLGYETPYDGVQPATAGTTGVVTASPTAGGIILTANNVGVDTLVSIVSNGKVQQAVTIAVNVLPAQPGKGTSTVKTPDSGNFDAGKAEDLFIQYINVERQNKGNAKAYKDSGLHGYAVSGAEHASNVWEHSGNPYGECLCEIRAGSSEEVARGAVNSFRHSPDHWSMLTDVDEELSMAVGFKQKNGKMYVCVSLTSKIVMDHKDDEEFWDEWDNSDDWEIWDMFED